MHSNNVFQYSKIRTRKRNAKKSIKTEKKLESSPFWNSESTELESGIQYPESRIHSLESRIQDCHGFPYMGRCSRNETLQEIIAFKDKVYIQIQKALWSKLNNLKPFFSSKKSFTFQQGKQHFGLRSESRALPTDSLFHKA